MSTTNKYKMTSTLAERRDDLYDLYLQVRSSMDDVKAGDAELKKKFKKFRATDNYYVHTTDLVKVSGGVVGGVRVALHKVEELALSLYRSPWKKELYTLKVHGVLIRNYLQPALTNYQLLLNKLGYEKKGNKFELSISNEMRKEGNYSPSSMSEYLYFVFRDKVSKVAFDLYTLKMNETENIPEKFVVPVTSKGHSPHHIFSGHMQYPASSHDSTASDMYSRNGSDNYNNQGKDFEIKNRRADDLQISNITTIVNYIPESDYYQKSAAREQEKRILQSFESSYPDGKTQPNKVTKYNLGEPNLEKKEQEKRMTEDYENSNQEGKKQPNKAKLQKTAMESESMIQTNESSSRINDESKLTPSEKETGKNQLLSNLNVNFSKEIIGVTLNKLMQKDNSVEGNENIDNNKKSFSKENVKNIKDTKDTEKNASSPNSSLGASSGDQSQAQKHNECASEYLNDAEIAAKNRRIACKTESRREKMISENSSLSESVGVNSKHQYGVCNNEFISGQPANNISYDHKKSSEAYLNDRIHSKTKGKSELITFRLKQNSTQRKEPNTASFSEGNDSASLNSRSSLSKYTDSQSLTDEKCKYTNEQPHGPSPTVQPYSGSVVTHSHSSATNTAKTNFTPYLGTVNSSNGSSSNVNFVNVASEKTSSSSNVNKCRICNEKEGIQYHCSVCEDVLPLCYKCSNKKRFKCREGKGDYHKFERLCLETSL